MRAWATLSLVVLLASCMSDGERAKRALALDAEVQLRALQINQLRDSLGSLYARKPVDSSAVSVVMTQLRRAESSQFIAERELSKLKR